MSDKKIDHEYTNEIVCPYCGLRFLNSWKYKNYDGNRECGRCGKRFRYERRLKETYYIYKLEEDAQDVGC